MKRPLLTLALVVPTATVTAAPVFHQPGPNLTYGPISNGQTLMSSIANPAAGAVALESGENQYRFGLLGSVGAGYEVGPVDSMVDDLDRLTAELDRNDLTKEDAERIITEFDDLLKQMGEDGYVRFGGSAQIPLMPLVITHRGLKGSLVLDASVSVQGQMTVLDGELTYNTQKQDIDTNTALYVKGGMQKEVSLGYSFPLLKGDGGNLYAGTRLKYMNLGLRKTLLGLKAMEDDDVSEAVRDEYDRDFVYSSAVGLDAGLLWVSDHYRVGATLLNANSPAFNYESIGQNCASLPAGSEQDACFLAQSYADRIDLTETHTMDPQVKLEAALYSKSRNWLIGGSYDTSVVRDLLGNEIQHASISAAYATDSWLIPGLRLGYRQNMAGTQLSEAMVGLTLFKVMNLDVAYGLESTEIDGETMPRSLAANLGLEVTF